MTPNQLLTAVQLILLALVATFTTEAACHLAPADKAKSMAVIVAAGGGNTTCNVGPEGIAIAEWLNSLSIHAFIERDRILHGLTLRITGNSEAKS